MAKTAPLKVDAVLADILNQNRETNGILPSVQLNKYLEESPTYQADLKEYIAKRIKEETPNAIQ